MTTFDPILCGDAAALIRAYLRQDSQAFEALLPGEHDELLLAAFGMAVGLAARAAGGQEQLDEALQVAIDWYRTA